MATENLMLEKRIDALLKEYESHRSELFIHIQLHQQTLALFLGSVSIVIPILIGQLNAIPSTLLSGLLFLLAIIYSVISMHLATLQYNIDVMGYFIHSYIEPYLNELLPSANENQKVLYWETFIRNLRKKFFPLIAGTVGTTSTVILIQMPAGVALFAAIYFLLLPSTQTGIVGATVLLGIIAVVFYGVSLFSWTSVVLLELRDFRMVKNE